MPASSRETIQLGEHQLGLTVCDDAWVEPLGYVTDPVGELAAAGASLVFKPSCSP